MEEYLCSAITEFRDKLPQLLSDCKTLKIDILPPDLNKSDSNFMVCDPATDDVPAPYSVRGNGTIRFDFPVSPDLRVQVM